MAMAQAGPDLKSRASKIKKWLRYSQIMKNSLFQSGRFSSRSSEPVLMREVNRREQYNLLKYSMKKV